MIADVNIRVPAAQLHDERMIRAMALKTAGITDDEQAIQVLRRSLDARSKIIYYQLRVRIYPRGETPSLPPTPEPRNVSAAPEVCVIGTGPAGLFAALALIDEGFKPILFERGKNVRDRRRDLASLNRGGEVNPHSNYCFGEGGAGTYSDGKLYTRSKKRGSIDEILQWLIAFGASPEIAVDAHPHIGTNRLPKIIESMREFIRQCGGKVHFDHHLDDLEWTPGGIRRLRFNGDLWVRADRVILATGHSARDVFVLLHQRGIQIEAKPFALGVRVEHPQDVIDRIQYHCDAKPDYLPPSSYQLIHREPQRSVYSFCMCPGGIIAPCATAPGEVVTNGWSPSKRNNPFANSGIVVEIQPSDYAAATPTPLDAMHFQAAVERRAFEVGGGSNRAPAQRITDFVRRSASTQIPKTSYHPGTTPADLREVLPDFVYSTLLKGFQAFDRKMKGYIREEAIVHATESRTSSPVRIPRDHDSLQHPEVPGLYPVGEGAGYAGGIVSAAMDGIRVARAIARERVSAKGQAKGGQSTGSMGQGPTKDVRR